ncbi:hypothetical protein SAMN05421763_11451 [[Luteovulum] sphaeroides subsp. megalophilum]|nr:hypothetical protein SAMN05421763_11451 [[Luteovulum] sphaeroides subsp. megalophilum]
MVGAGWERTVDGYLNRLLKAWILDSVRELMGWGLRSSLTI